MPINGLTLVSQNKDGYRMPINGLTPISQTKADTGYQSMDLHQSPKTTQMIPDANKWSYSNLTKQNKTKHRSQLPIYLDLC